MFAFRYRFRKASGRGVFMQIIVDRFARCGVYMKKKIIAIALVLVFAVAGISALYADTDGGLTVDPLVSLSYLNDKFWPRVERAIADALAGTSSGDKSNDDSIGDSTEVPTQPDNAGFTYEVVHLSEGNVVLATEPCEIILRSGSAEAYLSGNESGIADLTAGGDLKEGDALAANHLLLVPRGNDGRGFKVSSSEAYVMIRGGYEIVAEEQ